MDARIPVSDAREWARGKTVREVLDLSQGLIDNIGRAAPAAPAAPSPPPTTAPTIGDEDYATGAHVRAAIDRATGQVQPFLQQLAEQNALTSYNIAKRDHAEMFKKYEPEILQTLGRVPRANWTLDVIENAVKFVTGSHVDEIAEEKARRLAATMEPTIRSTGSGGSASVPNPKTALSLESDKIPAKWREHAKAVGITDREIWELCAAQGLSGPEEFFALFKDGIVTDAVAEVTRKGVLA